MMPIPAKLLHKRPCGPTRVTHKSSTRITTESPARTTVLRLTGHLYLVLAEQFRPRHNPPHRRWLNQQRNQPDRHNRPLVSQLAQQPNRQRRNQANCLGRVGCPCMPLHSWVRLSWGPELC